MRVTIFGQTALAYMAGMIIGTAAIRLFGNTGWWLAILLFACMGLYDAWTQRNAVTPRDEIAEEKRR